jgi:hypothetical protein
MIYLKAIVDINSVLQLGLPSVNHALCCDKPLAAFGLRTVHPDTV